MACKEVWLVRHGETESNRGGIVQGGTDVPLNDVGVMQAEALAEWLRSRPVKPTSVIASPLTRARRTAEILASALELDVEHEPRLQERTFGVWEGVPFVDILNKWEGPGDAWDHKPPEGEGPEDLLRRAAEAFDEHASRDDLGERLMIVAHGGPIGALACRALGVPFSSESVRRFRRDNTGLTVLRRSRHSPTAYSVAVLNATFHLDALQSELGPSPLGSLSAGVTTK
jgi:broad specificity phosphatase PhoE